MTIFAECVCPLGRATVEVSRLGNCDCDLLAEWPSVVPAGEFELWIGAIGPLMVSATQRDDRNWTARFAEPLDPRILNHFAFS